jgi:hypothetical protein
MSEWWWWSGEAGPTPTTQHVTLSPLNLGVRLAAPDVRDASEERPVGLTIEAYRGDNHATPAATLTGAKRRGGQIRLSDPGEGHMTLANRHPDRSTVQMLDLIRVMSNGRAIHQWRAQRQSSATRRATAAEEQTVMSGPGALGMWADAPVFPSLGVGRWPIERDRVWSWISPTPIFDHSGWAPATALTTVADAAAGDWASPGFGAEFEGAAYAEVLGPSSGSTDDAPAGICYGRQDFTIAEAGTYGIWTLIDNWGEFYIDGVPITEVRREQGWTTATYVAIGLTAGTHTMAWRTVNDPPTVVGLNPTGAAFAGYFLDAAGTPTTGVPQFYSRDEFARIVEYPSTPPGMTLGRVLHTLLAEWQALGYMLGWELNFTETNDTNGLPWPIGEFATKVGTDGRTFACDELAQTYCDLRAHHGGLVLDAYVYGTGGSDRDLTLVGPTDRDPATANITELSHDRTAARGTAALVLHEGGWTYVDATPDGQTKRGVLIGLGAQPSEHAAQLVATNELVWMSDTQEAITAGFRARNDDEAAPWCADVGDRITVPGWDGEPSAERLLSWTYDEDTHGTVTWAPELKSVRLGDLERHEQALKKMADGTVRGTSRVATPVNAIDTGGPSCCTPEPPWTST